MLYNRYEIPVAAEISEKEFLPLLEPTINYLAWHRMELRMAKIKPAMSTDNKMGTSQAGAMSKPQKVVKRQFVPSDNSPQATIRPKRQFVPNSKKRQFDPSDNSSHFEKATIRPKY